MVLPHNVTCVTQITPDSQYFTITFIAAVSQLQWLSAVDDTVGSQPSTSEYTERLLVNLLLAVTCSGPVQQPMCPDSLQYGSETSLLREPIHSVI